MAPFTGNPTQTQQIAIAITPKITGLLSMMGSGYIVYDCFRQLKSGERGRGGTVSTSSSAHIYQRLMIGMSISDMIMSFGFVLSTLPAPRGTPNVWGAVGTTASCSFAGMFTMMGVVPVMYNASLSIYYVLRIRQGWTQTQLHKVEKWLHLVPWVWGISVVIVALSLKLFNSGFFECWMAPFPQGCVATYKRTDKTTAPVCTRGDNIELYQWAFDLIPKLSSILIVTINMYLTWLSLYQQEQQTKKFSMGSVAIHKRASNLANDQQRPAVEPSDSPGASRKRFRWSSAQSRRPSQIVAVKLSVAQRLARQSYFYVGALYLTYLPVIVARVYEGATGFVHWEMLYTISFMVPFQGFWNAIVYLRPRYLQFRKDEAKRRRRQELGLSTVASEGYAGSLGPRDSDSKDSAPPRQSKTILQTIGDTFRDGAIDDEKELMYVDALEKSSNEFERGDRGRFGSNRDLRQSSSMRPSSAKAEMSKELGMETHVERFRNVPPMEEEESYHHSESMNEDNDETLDATQGVLTFAISSSATTPESPVVGHSMHFL